MKRNGYKSLTVPYGGAEPSQLDERVNAVLAEVDRLQSGQVVAIQTMAMSALKSTPSFIVSIHYTYDDDESNALRGTHGGIL